MKLMAAFEAYGAPEEARNRYLAPVQNAAAVLVSEYLHRLIERAESAKSCSCRDSGYVQDVGRSGSRALAY